MAFVDSVFLDGSVSALSEQRSQQSRHMSRFRLKEETVSTSRCVTSFPGVMIWPDPRNQETPVSGQFCSGVKWGVEGAVTDCTQRSM